MLLSNGFIAAEAYNSLPHISDNSEVPDNHVKDLDDLRNLLVKYMVPSHIGIRLIHKHYDVRDGEVMVFKNVVLPSFGQIETMRPTDQLNAAKLFPVHYFVDDAGNTRAYEYSYGIPQVPDSEDFKAFLAEFENIVVSRGLQRFFGLKIDCSDSVISTTQELQVHKISELVTESDQNTSLTEFEYPEMRGTILIPDGLPMPEDDGDFTVTTEWYGVPFRQGPGCRHISSTRNCNHCTHCKKHPANALADKPVDKGIPSFGGHAVALGTPFHGFITQVIEAW